MKIKTEELTGAALDWAVAKAEGLSQGQIALDAVQKGFYTPSTNWSQGGPIIEREGMSIGMVREYWQTHMSEFDLFVDGPTPLIAAMRCYVVSKLGDETDVPDELINHGEGDEC